jgi:hypothetical protein
MYSFVDISVRGNKVELRYVFSPESITSEITGKAAISARLDVGYVDIYTSKSYVRET